MKRLLTATALASILAAGSVVAAPAKRIVVGDTAANPFTRTAGGPISIDEYLWWQVAEYTCDTFTIRSRARSG